MALEVEIYEKGIVRPFSPTPQSLRNYKLSTLDQTAGSHYTPTVFFYNSHGHHDYNHLKESLSKTLSVLYPMAGRVKDGYTIECNDKGADFVCANVTNYDLADFVRLPKLDLLLQLFPRDPFPMDFDHSQSLLSVQVNKFRCDGMAVAICLWHGVADAAALVGFVQTWAAINQGEGAAAATIGIVDATKTFPPRVDFDFSSSTSSFVAGRKMNRGKYCLKRMVFRKQEIERMRDAHNHHHRRPSRVEALSTFMWAAVIRATLQANRQNPKIHILTHTVDLRKRMNPPFPPMCLGNIMTLCAASWEANETTGVVTPQSLIEKTREAIVNVTDENVRKIQDEVGFAKLLYAQLGNILFVPNAVKAFGISSVCGLPFHEVDFGWGKPIWFVPAVTTPPDAAYFYNTSDGDIEVWMGLTHQIMSNLDKDNEFFAYVSCNQIIPEVSLLTKKLNLSIQNSKSDYNQCI